MPEDRFERFRRETAAGVVAPDFTALQATSRRRRRTVTAGSALAVVAVVAVGLSGARALTSSSPQVPTTHGNSPTTPQQTHTSTPPRPAVRVPSDWDAVIGVAQSPTSAQRMALLGIAGPRTEVLVTDDGFAHPKTVTVPGVGTLQSAGPDQFVVCSQVGGPGQLQATLVDSAGATRSVTMSTTVEPIGQNEYLMTCHSNGNSEWGLNPTDATAHPIASRLSANVQTNAVVQAPTGQLLASLYRGGEPTGIATSSNGGASWKAASVQCPDSTVLPTASQTLAATCGPLSGNGRGWIVRSNDRGVTWHRVDVADLSAGSLVWGTITADGGLTVCIGGLHGQTVMLSAGSSWRTLLPIAPPAPEQGGAELFTATAGAIQSLFFGNATNDLLYRSIDDGDSWHLFATNG